MSSDSPALRLIDVSKAYRVSRTSFGPTTIREALVQRSRRRASAASTFLALSDINLEIEKGDIAGIIGLNGAGKSTLLKLLSRITAPTSGEIRIRGRVASLLEVGTGFHSELTGRENIFLNGCILGMRRSEIRQRFASIVDFAGVETFLDVPVKRYSSGMYVRLAFAVAAQLVSDILVVDEVLAVGDAEFQRKCLGKMAEVSREDGRTVLFVSHNMAAVNRLCRRAILLEAGRVAGDGQTAAVVSQYLANVSKGQDAFDLSTAHRDGTGQLRFKLVQITTKESTGTALASKTSPTSLTIDIDVECIETVTQSIVSAIIYDGQGQRLIDLNTDKKGIAFQMRAGETSRLTFNVFDLLLKPGVYQVAVWAGIFGEPMDHIENAANFQIDTYDHDARQELYPGPYICRFAVAVGPAPRSE